MKKKLILFGAGNMGKKALKQYGKENVAFFCDNNPTKIGTTYEGVEIVSFDEMLNRYSNDYFIMITPTEKKYLLGQLESAGIIDYLFYEKSEQDRIEIVSCGAEWRWDDVLDEYSQRCEELDLLADSRVFCEYICEIKQLIKEHGIPHYSGRLWESRNYGNLRVLSDYAGCSREDEYYFPEVSHINCVPVYSAEFYKTAVVFSGNYYKARIHKRFPYVPVFIVGPYIHYAEGIYSEQEMLEQKNKNGRTLLVFLPHNEEIVSREYERNKFVGDIRRVYGDNYETILLCVFWVDLNAEIIECAEMNGIKVVTAGFRFDQRFDRRLRSIIDLADEVICADMGTFIPYSLCLGKPIGRMKVNNLKSLSEAESQISNNKNVQLTKDYYYFEQMFHSVLLEEPMINESILDWMDPFAGFSEIKSREYIRCIFEISRDLLLESKGELWDYPVAVRNVFRKYCTHNDLQKMIALKQATGVYLN